MSWKSLNFMLSEDGNPGVIFVSYVVGRLHPLVLKSWIFFSWKLVELSCNFRLIAGNFEQNSGAFEIIGAPILCFECFLRKL